MVGRYRTGERIGRGGFGSVHRGVALGAAGFQKAVAIKFLDDHAQDMLPRLRDEARLLAHLRHRAIVRVDDLIQIDGRWALVMELVDGQDLARILGLGAVPPRAACELGAEAAAGLDAAHTATHSTTGEPLGLVHRDVKPSNLRVTPRGEVKVLDFGVARANFPARESTTQAISFGSPGYLAPERHDGVDTPAADVYALGVVVAECLLGERLGPSSVDPQVHAQRVGAVLARLPGPIRVVVAEMLAYRREDRPTAAEVSRRLAALAAALEGPTLAGWAPDAVAAAARLPVMDLPSAATSLPASAPARSGARVLRGAVLALFTGGALAAGLTAFSGEAPPPVRVSRMGEAVPAMPAARASVLPAAASVVAAPASAAHASADPGADAAAATPAPGPEHAVRRRAIARAVAASPAGVGTVVVEGDADEVRLVGPGGTIGPGSAVPAGSWQIRARFGDREVQPRDLVSVTAGGTLRVRCLKAVENCVVEGS
ncbi:MAG: serine/threonine-protein kinase [Pseudomonadota bacterium]|nr:serine/threonine-protein kinase [Pseudomonadota bacterium]